MEPSNHPFYQQNPPPPPPRPSRDPANRASLHATIVRWMWRFAFGITGGLIFLIMLLSFSGLPSFEKLENPAVNLASEVLDANGSVLGRYYIENRVPVPYEKLSPHLVHALIATEDERFYDHSGIDARALGRVAWGLVTFNPKGGGSTITQQLAKLLYSDREYINKLDPFRRFFALVNIKLKEWITAVKLERSYTKEEIIANYLNQFNFINGAYGIRAASEIYFGKSQDSLNLIESATLIGMLQNPALYNPLKRPDRCKARRNIVLTQMSKNDMISEKELTQLKAKPLDISRFKRESHNDGLAAYFRMELQKEVQKILEREECRKPDGSKYNLFTDGLKIYTTIDPVMQRYAEETMREHMAEVQARFNKVWQGKDPWTYKLAKTTPYEMELRSKTLRRLVQESDRYLQLRPLYLDEISQKIESQFDNFELKDSDIERMLAESATPNILLKDKFVTPEQLSRYRQIMGSNLWPQLKTQWNKLQAEADRIFKTPHPAKVFAYNAQGEKDTLISPLDSIKYMRSFLQTGILATDPITGQVKAWVGGINYKYFQYDHVRTSRQVGSTFKPFVYATAIAFQGTSPCSSVIDQPQTIHVGEGDFHLSKDWTPRNAEGGYSYNTLTLMDGLKLSKNTVSVYLMKQLQGTTPVRALIHNMGIDSSAKWPDGAYRVPRQPSICLGSADLSVYEMTGAYTTFANDGIYNRPIFLSRIEDKNGRVIYQEIPEEHQALPSQANFAMIQMLKYAAQGASGFSGLKSEIGGKTGTTNDFVDGWFMGVTPGLVVGTWVGGEDRWVRFLSLADGQGARMARPFFAKFLRKLENDPKSNYDPKLHFKRPAGDLAIELDCGKYKLDELNETRNNNEDFAPDFDNRDVNGRKPDNEDF